MYMPFKRLNIRLINVCRYKIHGNSFTGLYRLNHIVINLYYFIMFLVNSIPCHMDIVFINCSNELSNSIGKPKRKNGKK